MKYVFFLLITFCASIAYAHSPYLVEKGNYSAPLVGQTLRFVNWAGDGIMVADPVSMLIMDDRNEIYAQTPIGRYADVLCLMSNLCFAYVYHNPFIPRLYKPLPTLGKIRPYEEEYPEYAKPELQGFSRESAFYLMPLVILKDGLILWKYVAFFLIALLIPLLLLRLAKRTYLLSKGISRIVAIMGIMFTLGVFALWFLLLGCFTLFYFPVMLPVLAVCFVWYVLGRRGKRKSKLAYA